MIRLSLPRLKTRSSIPNRNFIIMIIPMFLIISSSVYPAILSSIENKEMLIIAEAVAQLEGDNGSKQKKSNADDTSGYHATMASASPTPISESAAANDNDDLSGLSLSEPLPPSPSPSSASSNEEFTTQAALSSAAARQTNNIVNTKAYYDIVFTTATSGPLKRIDMVFPAGTDLSQVRLLEREGIGAGGPGVTGNTLTYFVSNPVATVPAGTQIRLEFANIGNPAAPDAGYKVAITTRDVAGTIIDGPTDTFTYLIRQIGTSDIADNAITSPKIADGSVGTNDIADNAVTAAKLSEDAVHVIWEDNTPGNFDILYRSNAVARFGPATVSLSSNLGVSDTSAIAASGNNVYVVWEDETPSNDEVLYRRSTDGGATFTSTVNLSNDPAGSFDPDIAVSGNNVYVVWHDGSTSDISFRRSTDGGVTFGSIVNLSNIAGFSTFAAIIASANSVYVVWQDTSAGNNEIFYRRSIDGGATFDGTTNLSNNVGSSNSPDIAVSGINVYVIWTDDSSEILFTRSTDGGATFGSVITLSNDATEGSTSAIAASGNNVFVVWSDSSSNISFRKSTDGGATFDSTLNLSNNAAGFSDGPAVIASANNVYVIWHILTQGNFEILLRTSTDEGASFGRTINLSNNPGQSSFPAIGVSQ